MKFPDKYRFLLPYLKNKYVISSLALLLWVSFFDRNDWVTQYSYKKRLSQLNEDKKYFEQEIEINKKDLHDLFSSPKNMEKFAREKYLMKKNNEDIFVIVKKKD